MKGSHTGKDDAERCDEAGEQLIDIAEALFATAKSLIGWGEMIACYIEAEVAPDDPVAFAAERTTRLHAAEIRTLGDRLMRLGADMQGGVQVTTR